MVETTEARIEIAASGLPAEYLIGLACGHYWPGHAESDEEASRIMWLFRATDDSARCPRCGTQQTITGPVAKVLPDG